MSARSWIASLLGGTFRRRVEERALDDELDGYLAMLVDEKVRAGAPAGEARRAALMELGGAERVKDAVRDERVTAPLETALRDLRVSWRGLRRDPGFAATVILTLALGIGGVTGIFSVVNAVLFRPLPGVAEPGRLVSLMSIQPTGVFDEMGMPDYLDYRDRARSFTSLAAHVMTTVSVGVPGGDAQRARGDLVTGNFFADTRRAPGLGRLITPDDDREPGAGAVAVLGDVFWRRAFGADPGVIGRSLTIDGTAFRIVGVGPAGFTGARAGAGPTCSSRSRCSGRRCRGSPRASSPTARRDGSSCSAAFARAGRSSRRTRNWPRSRDSSPASIRCRTPSGPSASLPASASFRTSARRSVACCGSCLAR